MLSISKHTIDTVATLPIWEKFVVIEGLDGAGTTTQARLTLESLTSCGIKATVTSEPTSGPIGTIIRKSYLSGERGTTPSELAALMSADRSWHLYNKDSGIETLINSGNVVISDRYLFSTLAYQGASVNADDIIALNHFPLPKTVFFIDTPESECINRINSRGEKKEIFEKLEMLKAIRIGYIEAFKILPRGVNFIRVDGTLSPENIQQFILKSLKESVLVQ